MLTIVFFFIRVAYHCSASEKITTKEKLVYLTSVIVGAWVPTLSLEFCVRNPCNLRKLF